MHSLAKGKWNFNFKHLINKFVNEYGVELNEKDTNDKTPILIAAGWGNLEFIKELHENYGVPIN